MMTVRMLHPLIEAVDKIFYVVQLIESLFYTEEASSIYMLQINIEKGGEFESDDLANVAQQLQEYAFPPLPHQFDWLALQNLQACTNVHYSNPVVDSRYIECLQLQQYIDQDPLNGVVSFYNEVICSGPYCTASQICSHIGNAILKVGEGEIEQESVGISLVSDNSHNAVAEIPITHLSQDVFNVSESLNKIDYLESTCNTVHKAEYRDWSTGRQFDSSGFWYPFQYSFAVTHPQSNPESVSMPDALLPNPDTSFYGAEPDGRNWVASCDNSYPEHKRYFVHLPFYNHFHHLDLPSGTLGRPRLLPTLRNFGTFSIENLWQSHVKFLFSHLFHVWTIHMASPGQIFQDHWSAFQDLVKVRFYCESCRDGWTSMYGTVVFFYLLDTENGRGFIFSRVGGQKCSKCNHHFLLPLWYPEEGQKVITNVYYVIAASYYGFITPKLIKGRRLGHPKANHKQDLCQGCYQGSCQLSGK